LSKAGFHIPSLDGVRAVSFALVFLAHAGLGDIVPGGFGVTVFFFLSGFLITTLMRLEWQKSGAISLRKFYLRRVLRILPPFYIVLVLATGLTALGALRWRLDWNAVAAQFLHFANYWVVWHGDGGFARGTGVYWSLAVEEHFYFLFPLLYVALRKLRSSPAQQALAIGALCALVFLWRCALVYVFHSEPTRTYVGSDTRFDSILFGCGLAVYGNPVLDESRHSSTVWKYGIFPLGVAILLASFLIRSQNFRETLRYSLQGVALVPVFVCAIRYPNWGAMKLLNLRPVAYIGVLSYSLYLIHQIVFMALSDRLGATWGEAACAIASLPLSIGLALLLQQFVEKPCARLRRRFAV
jgi:peptidoglycan/LPS O-acetylase OafA/YrhL